MKILVVDDHPLILEALKQVLRDLHPQIEVLEARDGRQALDQALSHHDLSLVLLDLTLPQKNGFELLTELRQSLPDLPIVVLSASEDRETVMRAINGGAMGFIPKTSKTEVLIAALRLVFSGGVYLPPSAFAAPPDQACEPRSPAPAVRSPRDAGLTDRQAQVLALLVQGKSNKLICRALDLAEGTVKIHVTAILRALNVSNRTEALVAVSRLGLRLDALLPAAPPAR
ncbi:MAG: response regulator transcription factor [Burkholderiales bacterium]|nr:response regulator transcription factor [Burkholderiales bacterium]